jgi:hypothetical protein
MVDQPEVIGASALLASGDVEGGESRLEHHRQRVYGTEAASRARPTGDQRSVR